MGSTGAATLSCLGGLFHACKQMVTGAFDFAENAVDHKLGPKVFITLIIPKECRRKGDFESGFHPCSFAELH